MAAAGVVLRSGASTPAGSSDSGSGGTPLTAAAQRRFEALFGRGFGGVRLHSGTAAAEIATRAGAKALTRGHDIYFGRSVSDPESSRHERLLAHELAHVVQQEKGSGAAPRVATGSAGLAHRLTAAYGGRAQAAPAVTGITLQAAEVGVGRSIRARATVAAGTPRNTALTWTLVGAPAGVVIAQVGRRRARITAAQASLPGAGAMFTVQVALTALAADNAVSAVTLVGITNAVATPAPPFANQGLAALGGPWAFPANSADPNRKGVAGNTTTVAVTTAPAGRPTTITLPTSLGARVAGMTITLDRRTGRLVYRVRDNATRTRRDFDLQVDPVPTRLTALAAAPPATGRGVWGVEHDQLAELRFHRDCAHEGRR